MKIEDYDSVCEAANPQEIEAALSKRHDNGMNSFWLTDGKRDFPYINILAKGDLAYVHYFPEERHPVFASSAEGPLIGHTKQASFSCILRKKCGY